MLFFFMKVSIIIPVYNEKNTIEIIIKKIQEIKIPGCLLDIIVVDDGSTDGTSEILKLNSIGINKVIFNKTNKGKGYSVRKGLEHVDGEVILIQDADLEYDPKDYPKLLKPIIENRADIVFGSRFIGGDEKRVMYFWHTVANKCLTIFSNMLTDLNLTDMETCYKIFKTEHIKQFTLKEDRFGFEPEITAKLAKLKNRIYEVGISYSGRTYAEGKKIGIKDAFSALRCIVKYNFF